MEFNVLRASVPSEREAWQQAWRRLPDDRQDVYFLPGYAHASEVEGEGEACCAVARDGEAVWLYPFLKSVVTAPSGVHCDVQTPYGYGGPVVNQAGEDDTFLRAVWDRWSDWCAEAGVVGEFVRFHPLLENRRWAPAAMRLARDRETVVMWLDRYPQAVWDHAYFRRHRHMIRKAQREGCEFEVVPAQGQMSWFVPLYSEIQQRLRATGETRFGAGYFETLVQGLDEHAWLGIVRRAGEIGAAVLVLQGRRFAHSHLMGDARLGGPSGITNLVYHEIALEASRRGLRALHMGGGRNAEAQDALLRFKISLSPDRAEFWVGTRCHDAGAYERLASEWEERHGPRPHGYFLFYRLQEQLQR